MLPKLLRTSHLYIQIRENKMIGRHLNQVGLNCEKASTQPFSSERLIVADFEPAERCLAELFRQLLPGPLELSPRVVVHPLEKVEGGLSAIELRLLQEVCKGAGAREVEVWDGADLSDDEALKLLNGSRANTGREAPKSKTFIAGIVGVSLICLYAFGPELLGFMSALTSS